MRKLFILTDWWKKAVDRNKIAYPSMALKAEYNVHRLMEYVAGFDEYDFYCRNNGPYYIEKVYRKASKFHPNDNPDISGYDEYYVFGLSMFACVLSAPPYGYAYLPSKKYMIYDCCIDDTEHDTHTFSAEDLIRFNLEGIQKYGIGHVQTYNPEYHECTVDSFSDPVNIISLDDVLK